MIIDKIVWDNVEYDCVYWYEGCDALVAYKVGSLRGTKARLEKVYLVSGKNKFMCSLHTLDDFVQQIEKGKISNSICTNRGWNNGRSNDNKCDYWRIQLVTQQDKDFMKNFHISWIETEPEIAKDTEVADVSKYLVSFMEVSLGSVISIREFFARGIYNARSNESFSFNNTMTEFFIYGKRQTMQLKVRKGVVIRDNDGRYLGLDNPYK